MDSSSTSSQTHSRFHTQTFPFLFLSLFFFPPLRILPLSHVSSFYIAVCNPSAISNGKLFSLIPLPLSLLQCVCTYKNEYAVRLFFVMLYKFFFRRDHENFRMEMRSGKKLTRAPHFSSC